jgi:galactose mutarotase-like enzyme
VSDGSLRDLVLEAEETRVVLAPRVGGHLRELSHRGRQLLAVGLTRTPEIAATEDFVRSGMGGVDDCVPSIAPLADYWGGSVPSHGELWFRPAEVLRVGQDEAVLAMSGRHAPYVLRRAYRLEPGRLSVRYELEHACASPLALLWAAHPLLAPSTGARLEQLPAPPWRVHSAWRADVDEALPASELVVDGHTIDIAEWDQLPSGAHVKLFAPWGCGRPVSLVHPAWGLALSVCVRSAPARPHLGLWLNRGGFPAEAPLEHLAIEPTFGSADDLPSAEADGSCLVVQPGCTETWVVDYEISMLEEAGAGAPVGARPDG